MYTISMLTETLNHNSVSSFKFPARQLAALLQKSEQEVLDYYQQWKSNKKSANPGFDQAFIAGLVGQSKTTVSNFINQRFQNISAARQETLRQVIAALGYKPSQSAQLVRAKEKKVIAVLANITRTPSKDYSSAILEGIKSQANEYHYGLLIYDVTQEEQHGFIQRMPFLGLVDGLIIIGSMLGETEYLELARREIPVTLINPWSKVPRSARENTVVASIKADLIGLSTLLRHYQDRVQNPLLLTIAVDKFQQRQKKIALYQKYFGKEAQVLYLDNYSVASIEKLRPALELPRHDAFFCLADIVAICIKRYLQQEGLEALVTGYDNTDMARVFGIPTVNHNISKQGVEAFTRLFLALSYKKVNGRLPECEFAKLKSKFVGE